MTSTAPHFPQPRLRLRDWQSRLAAFLASREAAPFGWGGNDCALFAADTVQAITGHDPLVDLRGYTTQRQAMRILAREGGMVGLAERRFGAAILPALAQPGDIGLADLEGRQTFLVDAGGLWVGPGLQGLVRLPSTVALQAWRCV